MSKTWKSSVSHPVFTTKDAQELLLYNHLGIQRNLDSSHVSDLVDIIKKGENHPADICIAYLKIDPQNTMTLINGQHFCNAVIEAGINVNVNITYCECDTEQDIRDAYNTYDSDQKNRSLDDLIIVQSKNLKFKTNVTNQIILMTVKAEIANRKLTKTRKSLRAAVTKDCLTHINFISGMFPRTVPSCNKSMLFHTIIFEIILRSWKKDKKRSEIFWKEVRDGANLSPRSPSLILRTFLLPLYWKKGKIMHYQNEISRDTLHKKLIFAWNANWEGRKIKTLDIHESDEMPEMLPIT